MKVECFPTVRRHTLYFLEESRAVAPVYLDTNINMEPALSLIKSVREQGQYIGVNSILISAIARAMREMPEVNVSVVGRIHARQFIHTTVFAKFTLDKQIENKRIVCSATIPGAERMSLFEIQTYIDFYKSAHAAYAPCFRSLRLLHRLPASLGYRLYRRVLNNPEKRAGIHGSFTLTSLARSSVSGFYPLSGGIMTFGVGRIAETPVVVNGNITVRRALRLCLAFDHRALDGALASEFLDCVKRRLELINSDA